jgi:hypothetical protein
VSDNWEAQAEWDHEYGESLIPDPAMSKPPAPRKARPGGLITFPNGEAIFYDDPSHAYYRARWVPDMTVDRTPAGKPISGEGGEWKRGKRLTGASTLAKVANYNADRLLAWKEKVTCEAIASEVRAVWSDISTTPTNWLTDSSSILKRIRDAGTDADSVRDKKATLGTNVHTVLEGLAGVCDMPNVDELPDEEKGYARAVMRWWEFRRPDVLNAEQFVYHAEHGYAGRFDLRCKFLNEKMWSYNQYLVDLKTSNYIGPSYHVQLALYELAARACGVGATDHQMVLQVKPDGTYREVWSRATAEDAESAIAVYRGVARIEREAKAA